MTTSNQLEEVVAELARLHNALDVVLIIVNPEGRAEVCSVSRRDIDRINARTDLAEMLRNIAEETESGGGLSVGRDGKKVGE